MTAPDGHGFAGGACAAALDAADWSAHPLGPPARWPPALAALLPALLASPQPMLALWGPESRAFPNDAFCALAGVGPRGLSLGAPAAALMPRVWGVIGADAAAAAGGAAVRREGVRLGGGAPGAPGAIAIGYGCSPIPDPGAPGGVGGVLVSAVDDTAFVETAERFRATVEAVSGLVFVTDRDGRNSFASPGYAAFAGRPAEALLGHGWRDLVQPDDASAICARWRDAVAGGGAFEAEYRIRRHDGAWRWHRARLAPTARDSAAAAELVGVAVDVHDRREAEALARAQADELAATYDAAPVGLCVFDRALRDVRVNERLAEINGVPAAEHIGRTVREVVPDLDDTAVETIRGGLEGREMRGVEFVGATPARPGVVRTWRENWLPLRDRDGAIFGVTVSADEITEEKVRNDAFVRSAERLRIATDAAGMGIHDFDLRTGRITWDDRVRALWGVGTDEPVTYETFAAGVHADDLPAVEAAVAAALDPGGDGRYAAEFRVIHRADGLTRWVSATGQVIFEGGAAARLVGTVQDVTARREAELQQSFLLELSDRLREDRRAARVVAEALGRRFGVGRAGVSIAQSDGERLQVEDEYADAGVRAALGTHRLWDFGTWLCDDLAAGRTVAIEDVTTDPRAGATAEAFLAIGARSSISVPVLREGRLVATVYVNDAAPRRWTRQDAALLEEVARRTWDAIERERAQAALRESEARLKATLEAARAGAWRWDAGTGASVWDDQFHALYGFAPDAPRSFDTWFAAIHPEDRATLPDHLEAIARDPSRTAWRYEFRIRHPEGERWMLAFGEVRRGPDGAMLGVTGLNLDVTDRRRTEERLRASEERYRLATEAFAGYIYDWDLATGRIERSAGFGPLFGLDPDEAEPTGAWWRARLHPDDRATLEARVDAPIRAGASRFEAEVRLRRADGGWVWVVDRGAVVRDREGRATRVVGAIVDVTERRRAEEALRASEAFARSVSDVAPSILYVYDLNERRNVWGNRDMVAVLGYSTEEVAAMSGRLIETLMHPEDQPGHARHVERMLALADGAAAEFEYRFRRRDGAWVWLMSRDMVFRRDPAGRPVQIIGAALDITSLKETQGALERLAAELERRVAAAVAAREAALVQLHEAQKTETIGQLTGGVAHDFNNLLSAILSNLDIARRRIADPRALALVDGAIKGAERGAALTRRLLAFARRQELKAEAVDLRRLVEEMGDLLARSVGPGVVVRTDLPPGLPTVLVDANQLELAILNVALNARDAMPGGGALTIAARAETAAGRAAEGGLPSGAYVRLEVRDTGVGMDAETLRRAAEPFFTTKGVGKGTGLGLSMVQGLPRQSGGAMRLDSAPGRGATVTLWLPTADAPEAPAQAAPEAQAAPRRLTILVVDDDALVAMGTVAMIEELGHDAIEASGGAEALAITARRPEIDLVVTDHAMPGMTGVELARRLREVAPALPVVLATGYAELPGGADLGLPRLAKPFRQQELAAAIAAAAAGGPAASGAC